MVLGELAAQEVLELLKLAGFLLSMLPVEQLVIALLGHVVLGSLVQAGQW